MYECGYNDHDTDSHLKASELVYKEAISKHTYDCILLLPTFLFSGQDVKELVENLSIATRILL